jgi:hypothetical protein
MFWKYITNETIHLTPKASSVIQAGFVHVISGLLQDTIFSAWNL